MGWDHSRCYVVCYLNQVGVMGSQRVVRLIRCIVYFELGGCDRITAGDMCCVSNGYDGITAGAMCCVI